MAPRSRFGPVYSRGAFASVSVPAELRPTIRPGHGTAARELEGQRLQRAERSSGISRGTGNAMVSSNEIVLPSPIAHIVVVEDDHDMRRDLSDFLRLRGFDVSSCSSAEEYLALEDRGHLVLLDIGLTGMSGLELVQRLRQAPRSPKVVIVSAFGSDEDRVEGLEAGADAYVVKGASLEVIEATCQAVLRADARASSERGWTIVPDARLKAPNGTSVLLTHQELLFMRRMLSAGDDAVPRRSLLRDLNKEDTLINQRGLDNVVARLRRKVLQQTGLELPVRSAYGTGYRCG